MKKRDLGPSPTAAPSDHRAPALHVRVGVFARLGSWTATRLRLVLLSWLVILVVFGIFAPQVETALSGAGWQDTSSPSVQARDIIQRDFSGLGSAALEVVVVDHRRPIVSDPAARSLMNKAEALLRADARVSKVVIPIAGTSISRNGRTAIITAGSAAGTNVMVKAANDLARPIQELSASGVTLTLTGDSALWADFNNANRSAMLRSEMLSWPVTMIILVIAFGSLVAAGLPLLLTMVGLLVAAGALVMLTHAFPVSIWALNFALMFALALGIDYALFIVVRFRSALKRRGATPGDRDVVIASVAETMDTAGKAVAFSAITVLASGSARSARHADQQGSSASPAPAPRSGAPRSTRHRPALVGPDHVALPGVAGSGRARGVTTRRVAGNRTSNQHALDHDHPSERQRARWF
jgi:RND superfamily putative drug exporter